MSDATETGSAAPPAATAAGSADEGRRLALHEVHVSAGAAFLEQRGWRLPASYGPDAAAVAAEYEAARTGVGLVDLSERGVLAASGPDRLKFLHAMLSNSIAGLGPGRGCRAALLDVKGHVVVLLRALATRDELLLEMPAERLARVRETLLFYKVAAPVRFAERPAAVLGLLGPGALACLERTGAALGPLEPEAHAEIVVGGQATRLARAGDLPADGYALHVAPEGALALWAALVQAGARPVGRLAFDALRVEAGRPAWGLDVDDENLLHETGLLAEYHSAAKGCYLGQEVVARLEGRGGNVSRRLRGLRAGAPVAAGAAVLLEGRAVGRVTTAAASPRFGPIALAYLHRSAMEPGTTVGVGGATATVSALPFEGA